MANSNPTLLSTVTLGATASSITISNIPQTGYNDLRVVISARANISATAANLCVQFNGSSTGHTDLYLYGAGSGNCGSGVVISNGNRLFIGDINGDSATTGVYGYSEFYIANYNSANTKYVNIDSASENNATLAYAEVIRGTYSGSAISSMIFKVGDGSTYSFLAGTKVAIYGISALGTTPTAMPKASGGNIVVNDGTYWYHAFLSSGAFVPSTALSCDYLMVSGGGGGSNSGGIGAGGGGGALHYSTANLLSAVSTTILVGAGGAADATSNGPGAAGALSSIASTSVSVANGARGSYTSPQNGGDGGNSKKVISGTTTNYTGGTSGSVEPNRQGGGGAGAGANGANGGSGGGTMTGGAGLNTYSSWASATGTGASGYFAGGGGGGYEVSGGATQAAGGAGGGGKGGAGTVSPYYNADNGTANTGGGGGGGGGRSGVIGGTSGNGGSGIVIIRYAMA